MALSRLVSSTVSKEVVGRDSNDENEDTEEYTPYHGPGVDTIMLTSILLRPEKVRENAKDVLNSIESKYGGAMWKYGGCYEQKKDLSRRRCSRNSAFVREIPCIY